MRTLHYGKKMILSMLATLVFASAAQAFTPQPGFQLDLQKAPGRFKILEEFDNEAVLDTKTGLIWEKTPDADPHYWMIAVDFCMSRTHGGQFGWRLPTVNELSTLMDTNNYNRLPFNHPFEVDTDMRYWTQTGHPSYAVLAYAIEFGDWLPIDSANKDHMLGRWCVRSPHAGSQFFAVAE